MNKDKLLPLLSEEEVLRDYVYEADCPDPQAAIAEAERIVRGEG